MADETPLWLQEYQLPYRKRKDVRCHSGHEHRLNTPAVGFVLVRLNTSSQLELLLDLRSPAVTAGGTFAFIGGFANSIGEDPLATAYREAREEYNIKPDELNVLGLQYKHDHGGHKYLHYTYIFAEYNPKDGQAPASCCLESVRSQWFTLDALPSNLIQFIQEDRQMLEHTLRTEVLPMLLQARNIQAPQNLEGVSDGIHVEGDAAMTDVNGNASAPEEAPMSNNNMTSVSQLQYNSPPSTEQAPTSSFRAGRFFGELSTRTSASPISSGRVHSPEQTPLPNSSANITAAGQVQQIPALPTPVQQTPAQSETEVGEKKPEEATNKPPFSNTWKWPSNLSSMLDKLSTTSATSQQEDEGKEKQAAPATSSFSRLFRFGAAKPAAEPTSKAPPMAQNKILPSIVRPPFVEVSSKGQLGPASVAPEACLSGMPAPAPAPAQENSMKTLMSPFVPPLINDRGPEYATKRPRLKPSAGTMSGMSQPNLNSSSFPGFT